MDLVLKRMLKNILDWNMGIKLGVEVLGRFYTRIKGYALHRE